MLDVALSQLGPSPQPRRTCVFMSDVIHCFLGSQGKSQISVPFEERHPPLCVGVVGVGGGGWVGVGVWM